jgi:membrane-associated protease RseP (regulator of RpoE activity)
MSTYIVKIMISSFSTCSYSLRSTKVMVSCDGLSVLLLSHSTSVNPLNLFSFLCLLSKVELIKGNLQSVGLTLRLVQSSDGYAGHVVIETVAPNSPAAIADLQRGDRLIAIGGNYTNT